MSVLTQQHLKKVLHYTPSSGEFTWKIKAARCIHIGSVAGALNYKGYIIISVDRKSYMAHRLAWFYIHGVWPTNQIDHINHDRADNRLSNLREVTQSENSQNQIQAKSHSKTGVLGVNRAKNGKFRSSITVEGRVKFLGTFATVEEAKNAYLLAKRVTHSTCII
jgi:hypothetical protein